MSNSEGGASSSGGDGGGISSEGKRGFSSIMISPLLMVFT